MNTEDNISWMLDESHLRGSSANAELEAFACRLGNRRWRRLTSRVANILSVAIIVLAAALSLSWFPAPEYSSYKTSQPGSSPQADCLMLHQIIEHQ